MQPPLQPPSPVPNSVLPGTTATFYRDSGNGASAFGIQVGTFFGGGNLFQIDNWTSTSAFVTGLPNTAQPIWVRIWSLVGGVWRVNDYGYTAAYGNLKAAMVCPPNASTIGQSVLFQRDNGFGAGPFDLQVGRFPGDNSYLYGTGGWTGNTYPVGGFQAGPVWARVWSLVNGAWQIDDTSFNVPSVASKASITCPAPGTRLHGGFAGFTRDDGVNTNSWYGLQVGHSVGSGDILQINFWSSMTATAVGLPANGSLIWVRIWTQVNGVFQITDTPYYSDP